MEYDINRNGSGYYDPTAFLAIKKYIKEKSMKTIYSGEIYEVEFNNGSIKEAIILSVHDKFSTILCLGDNESLSCSINCRGMKYTDPGMLQYVFNDKVRDFIRTLTDQEYDYIMWEVVDALGYKASEPIKPVEAAVPAEVKVIEADPGLKEELTKAQVERDVYKSLYENLISSMIAK